MAAMYPLKCQLPCGWSTQPCCTFVICTVYSAYHSLDCLLFGDWLIWAWRLQKETSQMVAEIVDLQRAAAAAAAKETSHMMTPSDIDTDSDEDDEEVRRRVSKSNCNF